VKRIVLYHGNCPDGFTAAWAVWKKLQGTAEYRPVNYGQPPPDDLAGRDVVIVDFSYPRDALIAMHKIAKSLLVLDHHKTAEADLQGLHFCEFDMDRSGATMAWDHFHPDKPRPDLVSYAEDRDLWRFKLPMSREVSAAIWSYERTFENWDRFAGGVESLKVDGVAILRFKNQIVGQMADQSRMELVSGHMVPVANATSAFSEVGEELCIRFPSAPFSAYYMDRGDRKRQWGLRSRGGFDVSEVARANGGGGHKAASGWTEDL